MRTFKEWRHIEGEDGPKLDPDTIYGAENQLKILATNIRKFAYSPHWKQFGKQIMSASQLLERLSYQLGEGMDDNLRHQKYQ